MPVVHRRTAPLYSLVFILYGLAGRGGGGCSGGSEGVIRPVDGFVVAAGDLAGLGAEAFAIVSVLNLGLAVVGRGFADDLAAGLFGGGGG